MLLLLRIHQRVEELCKKGVEGWSLVLVQRPRWILLTELCFLMAVHEGTLTHRLSIGHDGIGGHGGRIGVEVAKMFVFEVVSWVGNRQAGALSPKSSATSSHVCVYQL
jgi:hypothetical protein